MERMTKVEKLMKMKERRWANDLSEKSLAEDIDAEYEAMLDELGDNYLTHPNGRDYDAEDEEGI